MNPHPLPLVLRIVLLPTLLFSTASAQADSASPPAVNSLVSQAAAGQAADGWSYRPAISADGQVIVFSSSAADLVPSDRNGIWDVFARDLLSGKTERISETGQGVEADGSSGNWSPPAISGDGRYVVFTSLADNLVPGDENGVADVFLRDRVTGELALVSHRRDGRSANGWSDWPAISPDGRFISFTSLADNLTPGDSNHARDIFRYDRVSGQIERVSLAANGSQAVQGSGWISAISNDGGFIAFTSLSPSLVPGSASRFWQVYLRDVSAGQTHLISLSLAGAPGDGHSGYPGPLSISADGALVAFASQATNLVNADTNNHTDIFVRDWRSGQTRRSSVDTQGAEAAGVCLYPALSPDGRYITFSCLAALEPGDDNGAWDVYLRDRINHTTLRISIGLNGKGGNQNSGLWGPAPVSQDGRFVAFASQAGNLVPGDANQQWDVYRADLSVLRGARVVAEARKDIGMPYCQPSQSDTRACAKTGGCDGPYHGFNCGMCTDVVLDAASTGGGLDIQTAQGQDAADHPEHQYINGGPRSAHDLWQYFQYTGQALPANTPLRPGDAVFFDWNSDGIVEHAALVSQVWPDGRPKNLVDASGKLADNPAGLAKEMPWAPYDAQGWVGSARLGGLSGILPAIGN
jgi:Tol biopolymer transport system component